MIHSGCTGIYNSDSEARNAKPFCGAFIILYISGRDEKAWSSLSFQSKHYCNPFQGAVKQAVCPAEERRALPAPGLLVLFPH